MNKVYNAKLNKKFIQTVNKTERALIFTLAHFTNEMNALNKLLLWTSITPSSNRAENLGRLTYQFMFIRFFIGKLHEGNELLSKSFYKTGLSKEYTKNLTSEANFALKKIRKYFNKKDNNIYTIRNSLAFHYDPQKIESGFENAPDDLDVYIEQNGSSNNLFYFGEVVTGRALISNSGNLADDKQNPYGNLIKEVFEVGRWFRTATDQILVCFIEKHKDKIWDGYAKEVEFEKLISTLDIHIPWFTDISQAEEILEK